MGEKINLLIWGDAVVPTGWSNVLRFVTKHLPQQDYNISWIGINYFGDPHDMPYKIYPASSKGDIYGIKRFQEILDVAKPEIIFLLNDIWVTTHALEELKRIYKDKEKPKVIVYFPVDAEDHDFNWYKHFDFVDVGVVYNNFGLKVAKKACPDFDFKVIEHGIDQEIFFPIDLPKEDIKKKLYPDKEEYYKDSFIAFSGQRNQPRKRLDLTLEGFKLFSENKPSNVKLYMHCGIVDSHIDILKLAKRFGIDNRIIITNLNQGIQAVSFNMLNLIYNATDVGINTSLGEGFGLINAEHSVTGAPQIVPKHSALEDLYKDCGLLLERNRNHVLDNIMTTGKLIDSEELAEKLNWLYYDLDTYKSFSDKCRTKFSSEKYSWKYISKQWDNLFKEVTNWS
jgi:D-inositol-3-phosphate glycosyltransferase